jgi:hypothetical protein
MLNGALSDRSLTCLRWIASAVFVGLFAYYVARSVHWPMVWDTPIMHYVNFLMSRGLRPYSDITDMNLPGCYLTERWGMAVFGGGDLAWRVYEFFLMAVLTVSGMVIGGSRRWFAGIYAATFFILMHCAEGPILATERDELMMVLLIAATALLFLAIRHRMPLLMLAFGLLSGLAMSLKPSALLLDVALLALAFAVLRRSGEPAGRYLLWGVAGNIAVGALMLEFLIQHQALQAFLFICLKIVPSYGHLNGRGPVYMVRHLMPLPLALPIVFGVLAAALGSRRMGWERWALFFAAAMGALSYFAQGKGYLYHRYMFVIAILLWAGWEIAEAMHREDTRSRLVGVAGIAAMFLVVVPYYGRIIHRSPTVGQEAGELPFALQKDLTQLGGDSLQQQVQCMDLINGCIGALYRMRLVQNTGTTGDLLLFSPTDSPAVEYYRSWFLDRDRKHPANVVVLGNEWFQHGTVSFDKVDAWPLYAAYLRSTYVQVVERHFGDDSAPAYRIYLRKGSAVLAQEETHPLH